MKRFVLTLIAVSLVLLLTAAPALANAPTGDVVLATNYPSVIADKGKPLTFPIEINNRGQEWQEVTLQAQGAEEWHPSFKASGLVVRKVMIAPGKTQTVEFEARPPVEARAGDYPFVLRALNPIGLALTELALNVSLEDKVSSGLKFSTQYPNLKGQPGGSFTFRFDLVNDANQDRDINLSAQLPQGWEATFKPAYESKQVSQLRVKAGATQGVDVDITTPQRAEAGDYKVVLSAAAGADKADAALDIAISGSTKVSLTTASGQLNTKATVDQDTKVDLVVKNTGTAPLKDVSFSSSKPDAWTVTFEPEKIAEIPVGEQAAVTATLRPSNRALAGDYMVTLTANGPSTYEGKDIRVTVETPTTWGWVAVAAIVVVIGGLGGLFAKLSRR